MQKSELGTSIPFPRVLKVDISDGEDRKFSTRVWDEQIDVSYTGRSTTEGESQTTEGESQTTEGESQTTEGESQTTEGESQTTEGESQTMGGER